MAPHVTAPSSSHPLLWLTAMAVTAYHVEYVLSFMFARLVQPIIIMTGRAFFGGPPLTHSLNHSHRYHWYWSGIDGSAELFGC